MATAKLNLTETKFDAILAFCSVHSGQSRRRSETELQCTKRGSHELTRYRGISTTRRRRSHGGDAPPRGDGFDVGKRLRMVRLRHLRDVRADHLKAVLSGRQRSHFDAADLCDIRGRLCDASAERRPVRA